MAGEGLLPAIEAAASTLLGLGIRHALIGGAAMAAWGRVRSTADADFLICLEVDTGEGQTALSAIVDSLREAGFAHLEKADRRRIEDTTFLHFWYPIRPLSYSIRLDILVGKEAEYGEVLDRTYLISRASGMGMEDEVEDAWRKASGE